jgi:uncharacterized membrane protein HdeD (DUF308 family)
MKFEFVFAIITAIVGFICLGFAIFSSDTVAAVVGAVTVISARISLLEIRIDDDEEG